MIADFVRLQRTPRADVGRLLISSMRISPWAKRRVMVASFRNGLGVREPANVRKRFAKISTLFHPWAVTDIVIKLAVVVQFNFSAPQSRCGNCTQNLAKEAGAFLWRACPLVRHAVLVSLCSGNRLRSDNRKHADAPSRCHC